MDAWLPPGVQISRKPQGPDGRVVQISVEARCEPGVQISWPAQCTEPSGGPDGRVVAAAGSVYCACHEICAPASPSAVALQVHKALRLPRNLRERQISWQAQYTPLITHDSSHATHLTALITHHTPLITHHSHHIPLITHHSSYTTHPTPLIAHYSSYTTRHTPLITHHSSHTAHHTPLITHHPLHTTHLTPLSSHHSSHTTHLTPLITHHSSFTTHHTPLITHRSSHTAHLAIWSFCFSLNSCLQFCFLWASKPVAWASNLVLMASTH